MVDHASFRVAVIEPNNVLVYHNAARALQQANVRKGRATMIAYVTVGADDMARAKRFYSAFLPALDYGLEEGPEGLSYVLPQQPGQSVALPDFYVKPTFDGRPASAGNGTMIAFEARSQKQVRDLHVAALAAGGFDEGQPGLRDAYGPHFYVGYLRDPQGNKIALFSSDPDEPGREG
tara:strand:+ start:755 stop:1285 length:531 start_codon:yes stop_codon:yes gene_type:complete